MIEADVCIVGSGPAGAVLGAQLVQRGVRVVVLESGPRHRFEERPAYRRRFLGGVNPWHREPESIDRYTTAGPLRYPLHLTRVRGVGGTSLHWQAETPRFHATDFAMHTHYGIAGDWPIGYEELEPYYTRAELQLGVSGGEDPFASPRSRPYPMPALPSNYLERELAGVAAQLGLRCSPVPQARNSRPYAGRSPCLACSTCRVCPTGAKASADLTHVPLIDASPYGRIVEHATVLRLECDRWNRVRRAVYAGLDRIEHAVTADRFVVAGGAVETPRLLLLSGSRAHPDGLANSSGWVGRGFREHPLVYTHGRVDRPALSHRAAFYTTTCNQFWSTPERAHRAAFTIFFSPKAGPTPAEIATRSSIWGDPLDACIREEYDRTVTLESPIDMIDNDRSRIDLDPDVRDYFGNPVPRISLDLGAYEASGIAEARAWHRNILEAWGAYDVWADAETRYMSHPSGTCRMGRDAATSVVNADLQAHDVPNLYLLSSAAFVTAGLANPTLTIVALALRLADHLTKGETVV